MQNNYAVLDGQLQMKPSQLGCDQALKPVQNILGKHFDNDIYQYVPKKTRAEGLKSQLAAGNGALVKSVELDLVVWCVGD